MSQSIINGRRTLRPGGEKYDQYFPKALMAIISRAPRGDVKDTVSRMQRVIAEHGHQTKGIAKRLKHECETRFGRNHTREQLLWTVWDFWFNNVQYKLDGKDQNGDELEELRTPARAWADRKTGIDCDCFTIAIGSTLSCLGVPWKIRTAQYMLTDPTTGFAAPRWRHVYVATPNGPVLDGVLAPFGYEEPYHKIADYPMEVHVLAGAPGSIENQALAIVRQEIANQVQNAKRNPALFSTAYPAGDFIRYGEYALKHWNNPATRTQALQVLADREAQSNAVAGFGAAKAPVKNFFSNVRNAVQSTVQTGKAIVQQAKGNDGELSVKEAVKLVVQQNPATVVIREGLKLALHTNLFQMAEKLAPAYTSQATPAQRKARTEIEAKWLKLGGLAANLQEAIMTGKGAKKAGLRGTAFGEPITAATLAASLPVIMEVLQTLKANGLISKVPTTAEVAAAAGAGGVQNPADKAPGKEGAAPAKNTPVKNFIQNVSAAINTTKGANQQGQQAADPAEVTPPQDFNDAPPTDKEKDNTLLYVGAGLGLLGIAYFALNGNKKGAALGATPGTKTRKTAKRTAKKAEKTAPKPAPKTGKKRKPAREQSLVAYARSLGYSNPQPVKGAPGTFTLTLR